MFKSSNLKLHIHKNKSNSKVMGKIVKSSNLKINYKEVVRVYFAKKNIDENGNISFQEIKEGFINSLMYIIIETKNIEEGTFLRINIFQYLEKDRLVKLSDTKKEDLLAAVGNYKDKGGTSSQAITQIILGINDNEHPQFYKLFAVDTLHIILSIDTDGDGKIDKEICYNLECYKYNYERHPNYWYNDFFLLKRKKPVIVIDPGHGYEQGNTGTSCRIYKHKIKDNEGNEQKDKQGNLITKKSNIFELPDYVINDYKKWGISEEEDYERNERGLVFDVSVKLVEILQKKGIKDVFLTRQERKIKGKDDLITRKKRIDFSNDHKADYFISIHADGGTFSSKGSHSIYPNSSNISSDEVILKSKKLSEDILKYYNIIKVITESPKIDSRNLQVLGKSNKAKRITLVELGFLSNPAEAKTMFENINKIAEQLAKGIIYNIENDYYNE